MVHLSFTSGEILDVISSLEDKKSAAEDREDYHLAAYYLSMVQQFEQVTDKLNEFPGESRIANLVMIL